MATLSPAGLNAVQSEDGAAADDSNAAGRANIVQTFFNVIV